MILAAIRSNRGQVMRVVLVFLAGVLSLAMPAQAEMRAVVIGPGEGALARSDGSAGAARRAAAVLGAAGFEVISLEDPDAGTLRDVFSAELARPAPARMVIYLAGRFRHSANDGWFLAGDAETPDLAEIGAQGIDIDLPLALAATVPGGALVMLAEQAGSGGAGTGLRVGTGALAVPQGVAVLSSDAPRLTQLLENRLLQVGTSLGAALAGQPGFKADGFVTTLVPFLPETLAEAATREALDWAKAVSDDTIAAYEAYLAAHPAGPNAGAARAAITRLTPPETPEQRAQAAEDALGLDREARREIQRALSLIGHDPRGIDGIFGPGSRRAIRAWQQTQGTEALGYLTAREEVARLLAQAARRASELEAEAKARREAEERADRAFWQETGALGDEIGLRSYLRRYPDGVFSEVARARLAEIEKARAEQAAARDRSAWAVAQGSDTIAAYRAYLAEFPQGAFVQEAQDRISQLSDPGPQVDENAALSREEALGLNPVTRRMVEQRLAAEGLDPGAIDGRFDDQTRRAIRRFQRTRALEPTGYLDERTLVLLLAGAVGLRP